MHVLCTWSLCRFLNLLLSGAYIHCDQRSKEEWQHTFCCASNVSFNVRASASRSGSFSVMAYCLTPVPPLIHSSSPYSPPTFPPLSLSILFLLLKMTTMWTFRDGCHHCGRKHGRTVGDHIPPNKLVHGSKGEQFITSEKLKQLWEPLSPVHQSARIKAIRRYAA
jgi:hypothetical protein